MATVQELVTVLREDYLSDVYNGIATATQTDIDASVLWPDNQLIRYLTQAQEEACIRAELIEDDITPEFCEIELVVGQRTYDINQRITRINKIVTSNGVPLTHFSKHEIDHKYPNWRSAESNISGYFIRNYKLYLLFTPSTADTLFLEVNRLPEFEDLVSTSDFEIPLGLQKDLIWYALHLAYLKQDAETYDPQRSAMYANKFSQIFGPKLDNRVLIHQLEEPQSGGFLGPASYFSTSADSSDEDW